MGDSLVEKDAIETARQLLEIGRNAILLPSDVVVANAFDNEAQQYTTKVSDGVKPGWRILDVGPETVKDFGEVLNGAKTVIWNGPMGVFEMPNFAQGTFAVARLLAEETAKGATTVIGGGDSAAAAEQSGLADRMTHISTGGGASLEMLEGKTLPGVTAIRNKS